MPLFYSLAFSFFLNVSSSRIDRFLFSVLLSVYAKTKPNHLSDCLISIWDNQSLKPSQIVLVIDGPISDSLSNLIDLWNLKLHSLFDVILIPSNGGLASALNVGLAHCKHELVARMDTDDVSTPYRFEKQIPFMISNPNVDVLSGFVEECTEDMSRVLTVRKLPVTHPHILNFVKYRNPISHPAVVYKKSVVLSVGGYPSIFPEDYPLWGMLLASGYCFANLDCVLVRMRIEDSISSRRGVSFLFGQLHCFWLFRRIGLFGCFQLFLSSLVVIVLRCSPPCLRKFLYSYAR